MSDKLYIVNTNLNDEYTLIHKISVLVSVFYKNIRHRKVNRYLFKKIHIFTITNEKLNPFR